LGATGGMQNRLLLELGGKAGHETGAIAANSVLDLIAKTISELGAADIVDRRIRHNSGDVGDSQDDSRNTLLLHSDVGNQIIRLALSQSQGNQLVWSSALQVSNGEAIDLDDPGVLHCVNLVANIVIDQFVKARAESTDSTLSSALCYAGILHLFRLGRI